MSVVSQLATWFEPWQSLFADSNVLSTGIVAAHVLTLVTGGGIAIATDRMTLRTLRRPPAARAYHIAELSAAHRPVIIALCVLATSGLLMATADIEEFALSPVFWLKLTLIAGLLTNGAFMRRSEGSLMADDETMLTQSWQRLAWHARASILLWLSIATLGVIL